MSSYHAWTHRPKELGGTDPIGFGFTVHYALLSGGSNLVDTTTAFDVNDPYPWTSYGSSDTDETYLAEFTDDNGDLGIEIKQSGLYLMQWVVKVQETNATNVIPPHIQLPLHITTGTEFNTSTFSVNPGGFPNWHSAGEYVMAGTGAGQALYLGGSYLRPQGTTGLPKRVTVLIRSEGGLNDWTHSLGQFMVIRSNDYPRALPA